MFLFAGGHGAAEQANFCLRAGMAHGATRSKQKERAAGATQSKKKERRAGQEKGGNPDEERRKTPCVPRDTRVVHEREKALTDLCAMMMGPSVLWVCMWVCM